MDSMNQNRSLRIGIDGSMDPRGMELAGRSSRRTLGSGSLLRVVHAEGMPRPFFGEEWEGLEMINFGAVRAPEKTQG